MYTKNTGVGLPEKLNIMFKMQVLKIMLITEVAECGFEITPLITHHSLFSLNITVRELVYSEMKFSN